MKHVSLLLLLLLSVPALADQAHTTVDTPPYLPPAFECPDDFAGYMPPRLGRSSVEITVRVADLRENLKRYPDLRAAGVGAVALGEPVDAVLAGPACSDTFVWWLVQVGETVGWTLESDAATESYWLTGFDGDAAEALGDRCDEADDAEACQAEQAALEAVSADPDGDADGDEVLNAIDFCPLAQVVEAVDRFGCEIMAEPLDDALPEATEAADDDMVDSPAPDVPALESVAIGTGDLRLVYNFMGITVINVGIAPLALGDLEFSSEIGQLSGGEWQYRTLRRNDCVQLYFTGSGQPSKPRACQTLQVWISRGNGNLLFWQAEFGIALNGEQVGVCPAAPTSTAVIECEVALG